MWTVVQLKGQNGQIKKMWLNPTGHVNTSLVTSASSLIIHEWSLVSSGQAEERFVMTALKYSWLAFDLGDTFLHAVAQASARMRQPGHFGFGFTNAEVLKHPRKSAATLWSRLSRLCVFMCVQREWGSFCKGVEMYRNSSGNRMCW